MKSDYEITMADEQDKRGADLARYITKWICLVVVVGLTTTSSCVVAKAKLQGNPSVEDLQMEIEAVKHEREECHREYRILAHDRK